VKYHWFLRTIRIPLIRPHFHHLLKNNARFKAKTG